MLLGCLENRPRVLNYLLWIESFKLESIFVITLPGPLSSMVVDRWRWLNSGKEVSVPNQASTCRKSYCYWGPDPRRSADSIKAQWWSPIYLCFCLIKDKGKLSECNKVSFYFLIVGYRVFVCGHESFDFLFMNQPLASSGFMNSFVYNSVDH